MKKFEILEKLKDFKDTDEIIFLKKEAHWVPAPEDSWDGDVVYSTTMVQVDDIMYGQPRLDKCSICESIKGDKRMTEIEKTRKRTRKNWKRDTRAKYRYLMYLAKLEIKNATTNNCYIERDCSKNDYFALWLVAKKLEAKGFKCELKKGQWTTYCVFCYDKLTIDWE